MRQGIHWHPMEPAGIDRLPAAANCLGIPVRHDPRCSSLAVAHGLWPWKWIAVGPHWFMLTGSQQWATLLHEAGHCFGAHLEKRVLLLPLFWMKWVQRLAQRQELEADRFTAEHGYGVELLGVLIRFHWADDVYYPNFQSRILALKAALKET